MPLWMNDSTTRRIWTALIGCNRLKKNFFFQRRKWGWWEMWWGWSWFEGGSREGSKHDKNVSYTCMKFQRIKKKFLKRLLDHCPLRTWYPLPINFLCLHLYASGRTVRHLSWWEGHFLSNDHEDWTSEARPPTERFLTTTLVLPAKELKFREGKNDPWALHSWSFLSLGRPQPQAARLQIQLPCRRRAPEAPSIQSQGLIPKRFLSPSQS